MIIDTEELHEGRHMKAAERGEVMDSASKKGLPRIRFDEDNASRTS
jgi:hypothetical protein